MSRSKKPKIKRDENNFLVFVNDGEVILNEEYIDSVWLSLDNFIKNINWNLSKDELKKVLQKAIKKELFFKKKKIDDFREKGNH